MRSQLVSLILLATTGCSYRTYLSGQHSNVLRRGTPRSALIAELGRPASSTVAPDGADGRPMRTDTYLTKDRIPDWQRASGTGEAAGMTFGLSEIVAAPYALISHDLSREKRLIVFYDSADRLTRYWLREPKEK